MVPKSVLVLTLILFLSTVNGLEPVRAEDKQFPFSALIIVNNKNSADILDETYCSGALLSDRFVLTPKFCVDKTDTYQIKLGPVRNGEKTDYTYDHVISTKPFFSTQYVVDRNDDDALALIYLDPKCDFTHYIQPIQYTNVDNVTDWLSVSGYFNHDRLDVLELRYLGMERVQDDACKAIYPKIDIEAVMCARGNLIDDKRGNFCRSSAGSVLANDKRVLIGLSVYQNHSIIYNNYPCEQSQVFARISLLSSWIQDILERTPS